MAEESEKLDDDLDNYWKKAEETTTEETATTEQTETTETEE